MVVDPRGNKFSTFIECNIKIYRGRIYSANLKPLSTILFGLWSNEREEEETRMTRRERERENLSSPLVITRARAEII